MEQSQLKKQKIENSLINKLIWITLLVFDVTLTLMKIPFMCLLTLYKMTFPMVKDVKGQLVLITGGGNGLGKSIGIKLAKLGCNIVIADIDIENANKTALEIELLGVKAKAYEVDVSDSDAINNLRHSISEDFGPVDILINNAGIIPFDSLLEQSPKLIEKIINVNVLSTILMTRCFLSDMIKNQHGHIVSISSMAGLYASPHCVVYSASKYAVAGFMSALTEHLWYEKLNDKIKTTTIYPYYVSTRQDIVDHLNPNLRFGVLQTDEVTDQTVKAILCNQNTLTLPANLKPLIKFMNIFPNNVQQMIRDHVIKEGEYTKLA